MAEGWSPPLTTGRKRKRYWVWGGDPEINDLKLLRAKKKKKLLRASSNIGQNTRQGFYSMNRESSQEVNVCFFNN